MAIDSSHCSTVVNGSVRLARSKTDLSKKRIAIVQSSYIPWKGYFDLIQSVDEFVLFDDVQFTRRDWRNRNQIKTRDGLLWLTIPVLTKGQFTEPIRSIVVGDASWRTKHWRSIAANYARAPHFAAYAAELEALYRDGTDTLLSLINYRFLTAICGWLGITTRFSWSSDYDLADGKTERLVSICRQAGADTYVSGPSASAYLEERQFTEQGIALSYFDYSGYPEYTQLHPPFEHRVSVIDLILNHGPDAPRYMLSF